ncbi:MAG: hypothetical protein AAGC69_14015 [Paracraurococcus sp.]|jgi:tRNA U34 5-methylaminomethyl-2-thiouridine-forming methyltransferase MnmC
MSRTVSEEAFAALVARAGMPLTPAQCAALHAVWPRFAELLDQIRGPAPATTEAVLDRMLAEPATTFAAEEGR